MLQISVHELHNYLILPVYQGGFCGARNDESRVWIGDSSLRYYMPKHINQMNNKNNITYGCETCIS